MAIKTDLKDLLLFWEVKPSKVPALIDHIVTLFEVEKDGQRCTWDGNDYGGYKTSCGKFIYRRKPNYCENCGRKVEVKEEEE